MPTLSVTIILNTDSGQMTMQGPQDPLVCADILTRAVQMALVNAAKQRKPQVEVAGAAQLRALPPVEPADPAKNGAGHP